MKDFEKEIEGIFTDNEEEVLGNLKRTFTQAKKDVVKEMTRLEKALQELIATDPDNENLIRSKVYQLTYQKKLAQQINNYLDVLKGKNLTDINDYLDKTYNTGFMTSQYELARQGIDVTMPVNQKLLAKSVGYNVDDIPLSERIYNNVEKAKKKVISEISRGFATGASNQTIARNLQNAMSVSERKAYQLAHNEGHRVRIDSTIDAMNKAKERGADIVKQWDATLDRKTRPEHAELDSQWAETDGYFKSTKYGDVFAPKRFGVAAMDINCRCRLVYIPRWEISDSYTRRDNESGELIQVKNYQEWYNKYYAKQVNIFAGKKYTMLPDGTLVEGVMPNGTVYEVDWDGSAGTDTVKIGDTEVPKSALKIDQQGEDYASETWHMNKDGTYSKGSVDNEAEFQLGIDNNKVYSAQYSNKKQMYQNAYDSMSDEMKNAVDQKVAMGVKYENAVKLTLQENGYEGVYFQKIGKDNGIFDVIDNSKITKIKNSKLEDLNIDLTKAEKKIAKIDNKQYDGIWYKKTVSVSEYEQYKNSIDSKRVYYSVEINKLKLSDPNDPLITKYQQYLDDLDEFEKLGKKYAKAQKEIDKIKQEISSLTPQTKTKTKESGTFSADAYTQQSKDNALWFTSKNGGSEAADKAYRSVSGDVWRNATEAQKDAIYDYTKSYNKFNEPLRGFEYGTNNYLGVGNVDLNKIGVSYRGFREGEVLKEINDMTDIISKSTYKEDIWLQRGVATDRIGKFFGVNDSDFYNLSEAEMAAKLVGTTPIEYGFMSTAATKGYGFSKEITLNIYAPSGTQMMYVEPFSAFGNGTGRNWDGISTQSSIGHEAEILINRNTRFRVTKVEKTNSGHWYIDMEVIDQTR